VERWPSSSRKPKATIRGRLMHEALLLIIAVMMVYILVEATK
jgi:hypothetical protein